MITMYRINLDLTFDDMSKRDNVYNKIKTALVNAKIADTWVDGNLQKIEQNQPENMVEPV